MPNYIAEYISKVVPEAEKEKLKNTLTKFTVHATNKFTPEDVFCNITFYINQGLLTTNMAFLPYGVVKDIFVMRYKIYKSYYSS
jgi:hypothetical protein